jgi:ABC-type multidrug transport system ATPase subunit
MGNLTAIDRVTFRVDKGEVLAFLGPNGAGKTTTMRILTSFHSGNGRDGAGRRVRLRRATG